MTETFQIPIEAAECYEAQFVPAFFAQWAPLLCDAAGVGPGQSVLDVGCGTGIVARTAADRVTPGGSVTGVDLNEAMLTVARRVRTDIDWRQGDAGALPFGDEAFDVVLSQMALMFFPDRAAALGEMGRVTAPGGMVAVGVPGRLDRQAAFAPFVDVAARLAGAAAAALMGAYFVCGDLDELTALFTGAGLTVTERSTRVGSYRAPSVDAMVATEVESTPLGELLTPDVYERIRAEAHVTLAPFTTPGGGVDAPFEINLVVARRS
jgi:SAM-dependent methyltransferase